MESATFARPFQVQYSERGFEEVVVAFQAIFFTGKDRLKLDGLKKALEITRKAEEAAYKPTTGAEVTALAGAGGLGWLAIKAGIHNVTFDSNGKPYCNCLRDPWFHQERIQLQIHHRDQIQTLGLFPKVFYYSHLSCHIWRPRTTSHAYKGKFHIH